MSHVTFHGAMHPARARRFTSVAPHRITFQLPRVQFLMALAVTCAFALGAM